MDTDLLTTTSTRPHQSVLTQAPRRAFTLVEIMVVVTLIGLLAGLAIPAFKRLHQTSQDRTVLNNARQIAAAADQYFMETGSNSVALDTLIGSSSYIKSFSTAASESYPTTIVAGTAITITGIAGSRTITFEH